ncbi:hypothetical protein Droror1_Dr00024628 [Drosera rotundifolia]
MEEFRSKREIAGEEEEVEHRESKRGGGGVWRRKKRCRGGGVWGRKKWCSGERKNGGRDFDLSVAKRLEQSCGLTVREKGERFGFVVREVL